MTEQPALHGPRTYPAGVTCWVDVITPDVEGSARFYGELFGWQLDDVVPPDAPGQYLIATLDGLDVAAVGTGDGEAHWVTYVATDDADSSLARALALGAAEVSPAAEAGPGGRAAAFADPQGHEVALWQARRRLGAQAVNVPGAWNFSNLLTSDLAAAQRFYGDLFGWVFADQGFFTSIQVPGYGDHLAATVDPDILTRQKDAPPGFADVIGGLLPTDGEVAGWHVAFTVADRDAAAGAAERLGGTVLATQDTDWTREARIRDPQGAVFTASQFTPPTGWS